jgi:hypothetical protein
MADSTGEKHTRKKPEDILDKLASLHKQATEERSHYYVGACVREAIAEIVWLRSQREG